MKKGMYAFIMAMTFSILLSGCKKGVQNEAKDGEAGGSAASETVDLVVWGAEEDEALLNRIIESFQAEYQGQADFNITFEV